MWESRLDQQNRRDALAAMANTELDILVVGGGVTGAGIAVDAVSRGLTVGLVEGQDWASGTSSRSSKLLHGGLRYLQQLDFKLVGEALRERELLLHQLAPHLAKPVSFLYPLHHRIWERPYVATGVGIYDAMAHIGSKTTAANLPIHKHRTLSGTQRVFPDIRSDALVGSVKYWDGRVDDARLVITLVRTAAEYGAYVANRAPVVSFSRNEFGRVNGAQVKDLESGQTVQITARAIIAAAGVWTEETQDLAGADGGLQVLASKGIHITVAKERIQGSSGIILQTDKSVLFIIPWERYWVIGTTDTPYEGDLANPMATGADIDYVLGEANRILKRPLTRDDVIGTWAGLRPLLQPGIKAEAGHSTKISREHTVTEAAPGLITVAGGKLTTYRVMAEDAVDVALGTDGAKAKPSVTNRLPLLGAPGYFALSAQADRLGASMGWDGPRTQALLDRYGAEIQELLAMCRDRADLARPLSQAPAYLRVEVAFACTHEQALRLEDLMTTRTRLDYEMRDHARAAVPEIVALAAEYLGWDEARVANEIAAYDDRCAAMDAAAASMVEPSAKTPQPV